MAPRSERDHTGFGGVKIDRSRTDRAVTSRPHTVFALHAALPHRLPVPQSRVVGAHILLVCTGNVCRSPFLELVLRARLDAEFGAGHGIVVESRGTQAMDGDPLDQRMVPFLREALAAIPGSPAPADATSAEQVPAEFDHRARRLEPADVENADLVITATRGHRKAVNQLSARGLARTFTLRQLALLATAVNPDELPGEPAARVGSLATAAAAQRRVVPVGDAEQDIVDPHGREPELYRAAVALLLGGLDGVVDILARRKPHRLEPDRASRDRPLVERDARDTSYGRARRRRRRRRAVRRFVGRAVLVLLVVVLAGGCWVGVRGLRAYRHLQHLQTATTQLKIQLEAGDTAGATPLITGIQANARAAHGLTADPVWRFAEHAPVFGDDLRAAATVAEVSDRVGRDALPPLTALASLLAPGSATSGSGRLATTIQVLAQQHDALIRAQTALGSSHARLADLDTGGLVGPEGSTIRTLTTQLGTADSAIGQAIRASTILPAMFDTRAPQTYLLLFQNLAEARSLGGIAGSYAVVRVDHGSFTLLETGAGSAIPEFANPVLNLKPAYTNFFDDRPSTYFLDTTETPTSPTQPSSRARCGSSIRVRPSTASSRPTR